MAAEDGGKRARGSRTQSFDRAIVRGRPECSSKTLSRGISTYVSKVSSNDNIAKMQVDHYRGESRATEVLSCKPTSDSTASACSLATTPSLIFTLPFTSSKPPTPTCLQHAHHLHAQTWFCLPKQKVTDTSHSQLGKKISAEPFGPARHYEASAMHLRCKAVRYQHTRAIMQRAVG